MCVKIEKCSSTFVSHSLYIDRVYTVRSFEREKEESDAEEEREKKLKKGIRKRERYYCRADCGNREVSLAQRASRIYTCRGYFRFEPIAQLSQLSTSTRVLLCVQAVIQRRTYVSTCFDWSCFCVVINVSVSLAVDF